MCHCQSNMVTDFVRNKIRRWHFFICLMTTFFSITFIAGQNFNSLKVMHEVVALDQGEVYFVSKKNFLDVDALCYKLESITGKFLCGMYAFKTNRTDWALQIWSEDREVINKVILYGVTLYETKDPYTFSWLINAVKIAVTPEQRRLVYYYIGRVQFDNGEYLASHDSYTSALNYSLAYSNHEIFLLPSDSEIFVALSRVELMLGNFVGAKDYLVAATVADSSNALAWHELGIVLYEYTNEIDDALKALQVADRLEPDNPWHLITFAGYQREMGNLTGAERSYKMLFERGIEHHWAYAGLAQVYVAQGRYVEAKELAIECTMRPKFLWFGGCWEWAGIAEFHLSNHAMADYYFRKALSNGVSYANICADMAPVDSNCNEIFGHLNLKRFEKSR